MARAGRVASAAAQAALACVVVACALAVAAILATQHRDDASYAAVAPSVAAAPEAAAPARAAIDPIPDEACAWVNVEGTSIDYPVAAQPADDPDLWLRRNLWGEWSILGTPFLASSCDPDGQRLLVFGHHIAYTHEMFSDLQLAYEQEDFDCLGTCWWTTRTRQDAYEPLFAMEVDESYQPAQQTAATSAEELRGWLTQMGEGASARAEGWREAASRATQSLCLVTCSSNWSGQSERTVVVFAR